ncbi:hypothetical protein MY3296_006502 [Beauveria thailandica]
MLLVWWSESVLDGNVGVTRGLDDGPVLAATRLTYEEYSKGYLESSSFSKKKLKKL